MPRDAVLPESVIDEVNSVSVDDVPAFVHRCLRERRLSRIVRELNRVAMAHTNPRQSEARAALSHMGFI